MQNPVGSLDQLRTKLLRPRKKLISDLADEAMDNPSSFDLVLQLSLLKEEPYSWRAVYVLNGMAKKKFKFPESSIQRLIQVLPDLENSTQIGCILHILSITSFDLEESGDLVDFCLGMVQVPQEKAYMQANAIQILINVSNVYPELAPEFHEAVSGHMDEFTVSYLRNRAKKAIAHFTKKMKSES